MTTAALSVLEDRLLADNEDPSLTGDDLRAMSQSDIGLSGRVAARIVSNPNCPSDVLHTYAEFLIAHPNWAFGLGEALIGPDIIDHPNTSPLTRAMLIKWQASR